MDFQLDQSTDVIALFRTPLALFTVPNAEKINPGLEKAILKRMKMDGGIQRSNVRGWHSGRDFCKWPEKEVRELVGCMRSAVRNMVGLIADVPKFRTTIQLAAWANVNGPGSFNQYHTHPNSLWSGVYYIRAGEYEEDDIRHAGKLKFFDPRGQIDQLAHPGQGFGKNFNIAPEDGMMLVFPSWLAHSVNSFDSDTQRISVAFNARVKGFKELEAE